MIDFLNSLLRRTVPLACLTFGLAVGLSAADLFAQDDAAPADEPPPAAGDPASAGETIPLEDAKPATVDLSGRLYSPTAVADAKAITLGELKTAGLLADKAAAMGMACRSVPVDQLDAAVDELVESISAASHGSLRAYKDLYRVAEAGLAEGLEYEYGHDYEITDTDERLASFR